MRKLAQKSLDRSVEFVIKKEGGFILKLNSSSSIFQKDNLGKMIGKSGANLKAPSK